jgi:hypothetical protein
MIIYLRFISRLCTAGFVFGALFLLGQYSIVQSSPQTRPHRQKDGIPPPPVGKPKEYFEWSYVVPLPNNVKSAQRALYIPLGNKVTVTCVSVSSNNLPDGQSLSGEIRFRSNFNVNVGPEMHVGLPPVTKIPGQAVAEGVEMVFFRYWAVATSGSTQDAYNVLVTRNQGSGDVDVTVCLFGYLGDPI